MHFTINRNATHKKLVLSLESFNVPRTRKNLTDMRTSTSSGVERILLYYGNVDYKSHKDLVKTRKDKSDVVARSDLIIDPPI